MKWREIILDLLSFLFILLWIYAASNKLWDISQFQTQLGQSPLLTSFAGFVSWLIPTIEIVLSIMLLTKRWRYVGICGSYALMVLFTAYIIVITRFSFFVPCSCGGILEKLSWETHLAFNLTYTVAALIGIIWSSNIHSTYLLQQNRESRKPV